MTEFKVGQLVEYIENDILSDLTAGALYKVVGVTNGSEGQGVQLEGFEDGTWWWSYRFKSAEVSELDGQLPNKESPKHSHYKKNVEHLKFIDVYRVLDLYEVTNSAIAHAVKKLLVAGGRGAGKDIAQDIDEAIDSLLRWKEMREEDF